MDNTEASTVKGSSVGIPGPASQLPQVLLTCYVFLSKIEPFGFLNYPIGFQCLKLLQCHLMIALSPQCDAISVLEKEHDYRDEHFDFIQSHIRKFCLQCIL